VTLGVLLRSLPKNNNFDLIRLILASIVVFVHNYRLSQNNNLFFLEKYLSSQLAVNLFFTISGFLITMSFINSPTVTVYFEKRARRILPAYVTVILFCSIAGFFLSPYKFSEYFTFDLLKYLMSNLIFLNNLQPDLPGVFSSNYLKAVNGSLWTIRFELLCYMFVPIYIIFLIKWSKKLLLPIYLITYIFFIYSLVRGSLINSSFVKLFIEQFSQLLFYFVNGMVIFYIWPYVKKQSLMLFIISSIGVILSRVLNLGFVEPVFLSIIVIYFACSFKFLGNFSKFGDFSYGIYIWHFPIIQTLIYLDFYRKNAYAALFLSLSLTLIFAFVSWHTIEKPFLRKKYHLAQV